MILKRNFIIINAQTSSAGAHEGSHEENSEHSDLWIVLSQTMFGSYPSKGENVGCVELSTKCLLK